MEYFLLKSNKNIPTWMIIVQTSDNCNCEHYIIDVSQIKNYCNMC